MYNQGYRPSQQPQNGAWYAPPPNAQAAQKSRSRKNSGASAPRQQPPKKKRSLKWQFIKLLLILLLVGGAAAGGYYWKVQSDVAPYANVFLDNVSVDGIDLSGKTWEEGSQLVWDQVNAKQNGWYIRLRNQNGDYKDITAATLGISFDPTEALRQAWAIGHSDSMNLFELQQEIELAKSTTSSFSSAQQSADTSPIDTILTTLENAAYRAPTDAYIVSFNPDDTSNPFTYQYETYGQRLDTTAVKERILEMVNNLESGEVLLETETIAPTVTVNQLSQTVELRSRALTPIDSHSTEDRTNNIRVAFAKINGTILEMGDTFSFNSRVGRRTLENGFFPAIEYAYGTETWGIGGGSCQASTTLYLAAAQAGLTITKREPHSKSVSYTELGLDATVSDTRGREIDLAFRNTTGSPVYISAHVIQSPNNKKKLMCEVRIYGQSLGNARYELVAQTVETLTKPADPVMKEDKDASYVTYTDETKTIKGRDGYVVESYLVTYVDNVETERKKMYTDTYPSKADTVYVGVTPRGGI